MRLRNVKGSRETIATNPLVIQNITEIKGHWQEIFKNTAPLYIEIGMGKGQFILEMARRNPDKNFIGIEKYSSVLVRALEKCEENPPENLRFIRMDAEMILDVFAPDEISGIYLNFSDPWPKDRHAKRRLTHENFLKLYQIILKEDGEVHFKTDNQQLFEFSLESMSQYGMKLKNINLDLHTDEPEDNIRTEYEDKFSKKGFRINRLEATF